MSIWKSPISLEYLEEISKGTLVEHMDIHFTEVGPDYLIASMPVTPKMHQPRGMLHGGASCVLAETVGSMAANFCVDREKNYCVGMEISANHIRPVKDGLIYGTARPFHIGSTTQVWEILIKNRLDKLVCVSRLTMAVLKWQPGH